MKKTLCSKCGEEISNNNINKHENSCSGKKKERNKVNEEWLQENGKYKCPYCNKEYSKKGIMSHIWRNHDEGKNHDPNIGYKTRGRTGWCKGLTKETDDRVAKASITLKSKIANGEYIPKGRSHTKESKRKISESGCGGYKPNAGKSKKYKYEDSFGYTVTLQSSYELQCAKILDELNIKWVRPSYIKYELKGKERKYYPDFYLVDHDLYLDPKNDYLITKDYEKINAVIKQNDVKVIIVRNQDLTADNLIELLA